MRLPPARCCRGREHQHPPAAYLTCAVSRRHNTLKQSNEELADLQRQHEQDHEDRRLELAIFGKTKRNEILNQNNDIAKLQKIHEGKTSRVTGLQNDVEAHLR